ncbi:MAG: HAMP domain-containing histidine kinase [Rhizobiales bacterium]|nr:HAMP domain-containing histidine kinase [Hyphomicrobiales bacterium]
MRLAPASIGGRLILAAAILIVVALAGAAAITGLILHRFIVAQVDQRLDTEITAVLAALVVGPDGQLALGRDIEAPPFDRRGPGWAFEVFDGETRIRSRSLGSDDLDVPPPTFALLDWLSRPHPPEAGRDAGAARHNRAQTAIVAGRSVTVVASAPASAIWRPLFEALSPVLIALAIAGAALVLAMLVQVRLGLRPLQTLRAAVADVRAGRRTSVPSEQPREVAPLVAELNSLIADNAEGLARARRHVSNLARGLKTPLATLALALDEAGRDPGGDLQRLVDQMDRRFRHHLGRARSAALHGPARARTPLAARVGDLVAIVPKLRRGGALSVTADVPLEIAVACEAQDLDEMLGNLVDNAAKWANHRLRILAEVEDGRVVVAVEDDGPGMADDRLPEALRPGKKLDEATPGYGFGLAITRELAELYGGSLDLGRSALGGLRAALTLPR